MTSISASTRPATMKAVAKSKKSEKVSREVLQREVLWCIVGGLRTHEVPDFIAKKWPDLPPISNAEAAKILEEALAELRAENAWLAKSALDVRLARFDRMVAVVMPDVESTHRGTRLAAVKELREIERDRQRLLLGVKQCEAIDRDLKREGGDDAPRTRINFVHEDAVRPGHEVKRDDDEGDVEGAEA